MLKISLIACLSLLLGCQSFPERDRKITFEQCGVIYAYESVEIDRDGAPSAELIIDMRKSACRCRSYKYSLGFVGPIANSSKDNPIEYCDRVIGSRPDAYGEQLKFLQDLRQDLSTVRRK